jgi:hypothetical protein
MHSVNRRILRNSDTKRRFQHFQFGALEKAISKPGLVPPPDCMVANVNSGLELLWSFG